MPAYNSALTIKESIDSVLKQSYQNFELIIIDDCSSDNTVKIVKDVLLIDNRIKLIQHTINQGAAAARNAGLDYASGDLVAFLDSDDKWIENKLEIQQEIFKNHDVDIVYSAYYRFNDTDLKKLVNVPERIDLKRLLKGNPIANLTAIYNFKKYSHHRQKKIGSEDYLFWLEIFYSNPNVYGIGVQECLAYYRVAENGNSLSGNKLKAATWTWAIYRKHLKLNIFESLYYFVYYIFKAVFKRI